MSEKKLTEIISTHRYMLYKRFPGMLNEQQKAEMKAYEEANQIVGKSPQAYPKQFLLLEGYEDLIKFFKAKGKEIIQRDLILDEENIIPIDFGLRYFYGLELPDNVAINKPSHKKGLLFFGNYGTGKSTFFRIIRKMRPQDNGFGIISANDLVAIYEEEGESGLKRRDNTRLFIDELGSEKTGIYFGSKLNVLERFLLKRYDLFVEKGLKTHVTTNLSPEEIGERYGSRIYSRLFEMFNLVPFGAEKNARDFRKLI